MKVFDEHSFEELLFLCSKYKDYRGVIVVATYTDAEQMAQELTNMHRHSPIPYLKDICGEMDADGETRKFTMNFETGSTIDIRVPMTVHTSLIRYHSVIVVSTIYKNATRSLLRHHECTFNGELAINDLRSALLDASRNALRYGRRSDIQIDPMDITVDTSELDDFLNGFKVN